MAEGLLGSTEDGKPATKGDEKKSKHLQYVGIVVGVLAIYLGYRWYQNRQASAATTTPPSTPVTTATTDPNATGGGGGGYNPSGTQSLDPNSIAQLDSDIQALLNQNPSTTTPSWSPGGQLLNRIVSVGRLNPSTTPSSTTPSSTGPEPETNSYTGSIPANLVGSLSPKQAQSLVATGTATPAQALAAETPAAKETPAQRHAQEVANRPLRAQLKK